MTTGRINQVASFQGGHRSIRRHPRSHTRRQALPSWRVSPLNATVQSSGMCTALHVTHTRSLLRGPAVVLSGMPRVAEISNHSVESAYLPRNLPLCEPIPPQPTGVCHWSNEFSPRLTGYACASRIHTSLSALLQLDASQPRAIPPVQDQWLPLTLRFGHS